MENPKVQEIFDIMGDLQRRFKEKIEKNGGVPPNYSDRVCYENFVGEFKQHGVSSGKLIPGHNFLPAGSIAAITPDIRFGVCVKPVNLPNVEPFRLEVDSKHRSGNYRLIHVNSADGWFSKIQEKVIKEVSPEYPIDLVAISGSQPVRTSINRSISCWGKK